MEPQIYLNHEAANSSQSSNYVEQQIHILACAIDRMNYEIIRQADELEKLRGTPPTGYPVPPYSPPTGHPVPPYSPPTGHPVPPYSPPTGYPVPSYSPPTGYPVPQYSPPPIYIPQSDQSKVSKTNTSPIDEKYSSPPSSSISEKNESNTQPPLPNPVMEKPLTHKQLKRQKRTVRNKSDICWNMMENGTCRRGDNCQFSHNLELLRHNPNLVIVPASASG